MSVRVRQCQPEALREMRRRNHHPEHGGFFSQRDRILEGEHNRGSCRRCHGDFGIASDGGRNSRFTGQFFSVVPLQLEGRDGYAFALELENQVSAQVLELQYIVFRCGNHRIDTGPEGVFHVGLLRGKGQCQDARVADRRGFLIGIDGVDEIQVRTLSIGFRDAREVSGNVSGFARKLIRTVQCILVEDGQLVFRIPAEFYVLIDIDLGVRCGLGFQACKKDILGNGRKGLVIHFLDGAGHRQQTYHRMIENPLFHGASEWVKCRFHHPDHQDPPYSRRAPALSSSSHISMPPSPRLHKHSSAFFHTYRQCRPPIAPGR